jgi:ribonuclease HI
MPKISLPHLRVCSKASCLGNPGPAAIAYLFYDAGARELNSATKFIGESTNNAAGYIALQNALEQARENYDSDSTTIFLNDQLMINQLTRRIGFHKEHLADLAEGIWDLERSFPFLEYHFSNKSWPWVERARNLAREQLRQATGR